MSQQTVDLDDISTDLAEDMNHVFCCEDDGLLLCGEDGRGIPLREDETTTCFECAFADEENLCPIYGNCAWHC